jgi:protoporphyrinogen oxidase
MVSNNIAGGILHGAGTAELAKCAGGNSRGERNMKVAIVGAGIGGLSAAYDLVNAGAEVVLFDAADHVGGLSSGFRDPRWDWTLEEYYHHWFASDKHILGLIKELGWSEQVIFPRPTTAVFHDGQFYALDSAFAVLRFPGISLINRFRLGMVVAYLKFIASWHPLEKITAESWMKKWMGKEAYKTLWEPLLIGKFGPHFREVNMAWMWARFKARTPRLGTFVGGFQVFLDLLADHIQSKGATLRLSTPVHGIEPEEMGRVKVILVDEEEVFDQCLVTTSPAQLATFTPSLPESYINGLLSLKSMGAVVMILALRNQLAETGIYWHSLPKDAGFPFLSLVEHTNYVSKDHFGGDHIVYCGDYLDPDHEYFSLAKGELLERFLPALKRFNPKFEKSWVRDSWLFRTSYAQPVPPVNHSQSVPELKTPMRGLWFASMSQIYPWDRGTNYAVKIGRQAARRMLDERE